MIRIGLGHDTHRLAPGTPLMIGGVQVPHQQGPVAHSDGDVLLHAVIDALLGAAGLGDIGERFPDHDPAYAGANSSLLLEEVMQELRQRGWRVGNLDGIVFAQQPKLGPFKQTIRERLATLLDIPVEQVNIKAKTGERVGPIGREEAISAEVVLTLIQ